MESESVMQIKCDNLTLCDCRLGVVLVISSLQCIYMRTVIMRTNTGDIYGG